MLCEVEVKVFCYYVDSPDRVVRQVSENTLIDQEYPEWYINNCKKYGKEMADHFCTTTDFINEWAYNTGAWEVTE